MARWYSREDRERMAQGLPLEEHPTLTADDYKDLMQFALQEAAAASPAKDMLGNVEVADMNGKYAGLTSSNKDADGKPTGKYDVTIDWGSKMQANASDPTYGQAYAAQRFASVWHELRHVEQNAMLNGSIPLETDLDKEVVTQMTVNNLYPTVYRRGYGNTVTEIDADVSGIEGARAFFASHPEIKERYGFDFEKQIMLTDEYDVLEDRFQVTTATPDDLLKGMNEYRAGIYDDKWLTGEKEKARAAGTEMGNTESILMEHLESAHGVTWDQLETMDNDERNVLLIQNAIEVMDDPNYRIAPNLMKYRTGAVMTERYDEAIRDENNIRQLMESSGMTPEEMAVYGAVPDDAAAQTAPSVVITNTPSAYGMSGRIPGKPVILPGTIREDRVRIAETRLNVPVKSNDVTGRDLSII